MQDAKETRSGGQHDQEEEIGVVGEIIEERKELIEDLFEKAEEYIKTNIQLAKLKATEKVSEIVGTLVTQITIIVLAFFFLLMINVGIALWLGGIMGKPHYGFMVVAGFYALLVLICVVFRKSLIKTPISNSITSQILK